jgi:hypothetical protein
MLHKKVMTTLLYPALMLLSATPQSVSANSAVDSPSGSAASDMRALSIENKKKYAASHFLGFYTAFGSIASDVCQAEGVDVTAYVSAFTLKHTAEFAKAQKIILASGISDEQMASIARGRRSVMEAKLRRAMLDLAVALHKTTVADGCSYVASNPTDAASAQSYAEASPDVEAILMSD